MVAAVLAVAALVCVCVRVIVLRFALRRASSAIPTANDSLAVKLIDSIQDAESEQKEEHSRDDERSLRATHPIPSKVPLASRQTLCYLACAWHVASGMWSVQAATLGRAGSLIHGALEAEFVLSAAWLMAAGGDAMEQSYRDKGSARRDKKSISPWLFVTVLLATVASAVLDADKLSHPLKSQDDLVTLLAVVHVASEVGIVLVMFRASVSRTTLSYLSDCQPNTEEQALSLFSICLFSWLTPILRLGLGPNARLDLSDLPPISGADAASSTWRRFAQILGSREQPRVATNAATTHKAYPPRRLWLQLIRLVGAQFSAFATFAVLSVLASYGRIISLFYFLAQLSDNVPTTDARLWASLAGLFVAPLLSAMLTSLTSSLQTRMSLRCRAGLIVLIYRKALRVDLCATSASVGEIVNLMSADVDSIVWTAAYSEQLWLPLLQASLCLAFLFVLVGPSGLCAASIMAVMAVANNRGFKYIWSTQKGLMKARDRRLETITEALQNIRIVKLCGMQLDIHAAVSKWRNEELAHLRSFQLGVAVLITFITSGPKLAALSTFLCYTLVFGHDITPALAFTMLSLLSSLEDSFVALPNALDALTRAGAI